MIELIDFEHEDDGPILFFLFFGRYGIADGLQGGLNLAVLDADQQGGAAFAQKTARGGDTRHAEVGRGECMRDCFTVDVTDDVASRHVVVGDVVEQALDRVLRDI